MPEPVPDHLTHYTKAPGSLFRSITARPLDQARAVVRACLEEANTLAHVRFRDETYLGKRIDLERRIQGLFVEKGVCAATTREIAQNAGTAEGNLYRHFPSKDSLARHIFGECAGRFRKHLIDRVEEEKDPASKLRGLISGIFQFAESSPNEFAFIVLSHHSEFSTGPVRNPQYLPKDVFIDVIREGTQAYILPKRDDLEASISI